MSCSFGGKGEETNCEAFLVRSGVDCNHFEVRSLHRENEGHFAAENIFVSDEKGILVVSSLFGNNHAAVFMNDSRFGNLRDCVFVESEKNVSSTPLPLNVNGGLGKENGAGLTFVICSSLEGNACVSALYMVRSGFKDNKFKSKLFSGEDKYEFSQVDGILHVRGPPEAQYAVCHNRDNLIQPTTSAYVAQRQSLDGQEPVVLCDKAFSQAAFVVLCSNSNGLENASVATMYFVNVNGGNNVVSKEIAGICSKMYKTSDLWTFEVKDSKLWAKGPSGPCKYGLISNLCATPAELKTSQQQKTCLVSGETTQTKGSVTVTQDKVTGEINKQSAIHIMWNHKKLAVISKDQLKKLSTSFSFEYHWGESEKTLGNHIVRVFAVRQHVKSKWKHRMSVGGQVLHLFHVTLKLIYISV